MVPRWLHESDSHREKPPVLTRALLFHCRQSLYEQPYHQCRLCAQAPGSNFLEELELFSKDLSVKGGFFCGTSQGLAANFEAESHLRTVNVRPIEPLYCHRYSYLPHQ
jgi:hypothetical protein